MKISMINIIVSAFVLSVTAGLFYLNRRPAENIDDVTLLTLFKKGLIFICAMYKEKHKIYCC